MSISPHVRYLALSAALFLFVVFNWYQFAREYSRIGTSEDMAVPLAASPERDASESGLPTWLAQPGMEKSRVIAERNMFSPLRTEWVPPEDRAAQSGEAGALQPTGQGRDDVELRGVAVFGDRRTAVLRFKAFKPERIMTLAEGESTDPDGSGTGQSFTLERIEDEYVLLRDRAGTVFQIGLFDHRRAVQPLKDQGSRVFITPLPKATGGAATIVAPGEGAAGREGAGQARPGAGPKG